MEEAAAEKIYAAEKNVAAMHLAIVLLNTSVFLFLMGRANTIPWLAHLVIASALVYGLFVCLYEPYRRYSLLLSSYFTSGSDAIFITLWILATGGIDSPFYVLWYASITAIAYRYTYRETLVAAGLYVMSYLALCAALGAISGHLTELTVRTSYVFVVAVLGGSLAREAYQQTKDKIVLRNLVRRLEEEITERQRTEEALQEGEERYRSLFENANDGIATFTLDGTFTGVNWGFEQMLGWSRAELIGRRYHEFATPASAARGAERTRRGLAGEKLPPGFEAEMIHKDGYGVLVDVHDRFIRDVAGKLIGVQVIFRDITARKRAEEALRESQERLRTVITGAPIVLFAADHEGVLTLSEGKGLEALGHKPGESVGRSVFEMYHDLPQIGENMRRALAGETFTTTVEVGRTTFETWHSPLRGQNGEVTGVIGVSTDITARKRAEEERDRFFTLSLDMFGIAGGDGYFKRVNPAFEQTLGFTSAEILAAPFLAFVHPEDRAATIAEVQKIVSGTPTISFENRYRCKDGSYKWLAWNAAPAEDGLLYATARDITERKQMEEALRQAEEKYRSIFENAIEGIFQTTPAGQILSANPAVARMLGYASPEELTAQVTNVGTQMYVDPHRRAEVLEMLREHGTVRGVEIQFRRKDGSTFWAALNIQAIRNAHDTTLYCSVEDITKRRAVDKLKEEFVSLVSHELRTPLTSIRGSLGLLTSGKLGPVPDQGQRMLHIAVRNTDRLVRLINDILDVERIQSGKVSMAKTACLAADLMAQAAEVMRAMAEKAGVTLVVQPVGAQLLADPDRIMQTLTNLLSNAIKFSLAGTTVWLTAEQQGEQLLVQVKDQGRGIPVDKLESIFERFQQVDASDAREKGGTGLGLAICRSIVHQHEGRIWAESTLGEGSIFSFTLPLFKERQPAASVSVGPPATAENEKGPTIGVREEQTRRLQVLVAEDDRDLARVLIAMFERHGAVAYYAETGAEAIQCCNLVIPDLVVLDPVMPEQDGFVMVDWMRQHDHLSQIPVVVYAAGELTATEQQRLTLGPTRFFTKSRVTPEQFEQQVIHWLGRLLLTREEVHSYGDNQTHLCH